MRRLVSWLAPPTIVVLGISVGLAQQEPRQKTNAAPVDQMRSTSSSTPSPGGEMGDFSLPLFKNLITEIPEFREWIEPRKSPIAPISDDDRALGDTTAPHGEVDGASAEGAPDPTSAAAEGSAEAEGVLDAQPMDDETVDWESNVASREQGLTRLSGAIARQFKELEEREKKIQALFAEAEAARRFAEESCGGPIVTAPTAVSVIPSTAEEQAKNLDLVLKMLKKMKPALVAKLMGEWDDALVIRALKGLGERAASPIVSKMPIDMGSRIMRRIATGRASVRLGGQL